VNGELKFIDRLPARKETLVSDRRVGGPHMRLEGVKKINIKRSAAIEQGFPVGKSLFIKLDILTQGLGMTWSFVTLTVFRSEIVTGSNG
jgi:hypothetical protein